MKYPPNRHSLANAVAKSVTQHWSRVRWLPFAFAAAGSIAVAAFAPDGRKPAQIEWTLSLEALSSSLNKGPHVGASALIALFAVIAAGRLRLPLAFTLTVLVGASWEIAQTTVIGHRARISDLAPDAFGAMLGCGWGACLMWLTEPQHRVRTRREPTPW